MLHEAVGKEHFRNYPTEAKNAFYGSKLDTVLDQARGSAVSHRLSLAWSETGATGGSVRLGTCNISTSQLSPYASR